MCGDAAYISIVTILAACVVLSRPVLATDSASPEEAALEAVVLNGLSQNVQRLNCGVLVWDRATQEDDFIPGRTVKTTGTYQMWWIGDKVAVRYLEDRVYAKGTEWETKQSGEVKAFDGKEFRVAPNVRRPKDIAVGGEPKFGQYQNWLEVVQWKRKDDLAALIQHVRDLPGTHVGWTWADGSDSGLIRMTISRAVDEARTVQYFDPEMGFNRVREEWFDEKGRLYVEEKLAIEPVEDGAWFPFALETRSIDPESGKTKLYHKYSIRKNESFLNKPDMTPDEVFTIPIADDMEISDYRGGVRINYSRDVAPLDNPDLLASVRRFTADTVNTSDTQPASLPASEGSTACKTTPGAIYGPAEWYWRPARYWWVFLMLGTCTCLVALAGWSLRRQSRH